MSQWIKYLYRHHKDISYRGIIKGFFFKLVSNDAYHSVLYRRRLSKCNECPYKEFVLLVGSICEQCGCILRLKLSNPDEQCPIGKWKREENFKNYL